MGMNLGGSSLHADEDPIMDINTTPLIDVMLVLLVMLIITIPIQLHAVALNLPVGAPAGRPVQHDVVDIDIDEADVVRWRGEPVGSRTELEGRLLRIAAEAEPPEVRIRPDRRSSYNAFAEIMAAAHRAGLVKLSVVSAAGTQP